MNGVYEGVVGFRPGLFQQGGHGFVRQFGHCGADDENKCGDNGEYEHAAGDVTRRMAKMAQHVQTRGREKNDDRGKQAPKGGNGRQLELAFAFQGMDAIKQMTQAWPHLGVADHIFSCYGNEDQTLLVE